MVVNLVRFQVPTGGRRTVAVTVHKSRVMEMKVGYNLFEYHTILLLHGGKDSVNLFNLPGV